MDGLLGVVGMMKLLVMTGIIPEDSLRLAPVSSCDIYHPIGNKFGSSSLFSS